MPLSNQKVRNLNTRDRAAFYQHWIDEIENTVFPSDYNYDKAVLTAHIQAIKQKVESGEI